MSDKEFRLPEPTSFHLYTNANKKVAEIDADGIMRFKVEANDENAAQFVEAIERYIQRRLNGVEVTKVE